MENFYRTNIIMVRLELKKTQEEFAQPLGIKGTSVSAWERGVANPSKQSIELMKDKYGINPDFLEKNEGEMFSRPIFKIAETEPEYNQHGGWKPRALSDDFHLVQTILDILTSKTIYAKALAANVDAFHQALETEKKLAEQGKELADLKQRVADLEAKLAGDERANSA